MVKLSPGLILGIGSPASCHIVNYKRFSLTSLCKTKKGSCRAPLVIILPHQIPRVAQLARTELVLGKEQDGQHHAECAHDDIRNAKERVPTTEPGRCRNHNRLLAIKCAHDKVWHKITQVNFKSPSTSIDKDTIHLLLETRNSSSVPAARSESMRP
ncbi:hypothetical protein PsorP6_004963 [Peronosclerospora sorghi]|uniref:Uncharacterized protein n=1 Tax=Peronosclerospora sorghi TaxID=230839 RepID=A0ACC0W6R3_9STRA|nr:hypothetical protein PsorP6_004963 [Peronosclerospora sorghi]